MFIEDYIRISHHKEVLKKVRKVIEHLPEVPSGTVVRCVREDREDH